jgi:hypothetical protein
MDPVYGPSKMPSKIMYHKPLKYGIKPRDIKQIAQKNPNLTVKEAEKIIKKILEETTDLVLKDIRKWVSKFVPKRTGQLRKNLLLNLKSSRIKGYIMNIIVRTSIDYAAQVNAYSTAQVRHRNAKREHYVDYRTKGKKYKTKGGKTRTSKGRAHHPYAYAYYGGHYGRIVLNDPMAIGEFFDKMIIFTIKTILFHLVKVKKKYSARTKMKYKEMRIIKLW